VFTLCFRFLDFERGYVLKRLIEKQLVDWKNSSDRKPLILRGARQVGKTWLVEKSLGSAFEHVAIVDFEEHTEIHKHFDYSLTPQLLLQAIEFITGKIIPGKTLLFFDEIQACPRAIMALRYFYEKMPELHVVAAGSLLEFAFDSISVPVGRVEYLYVLPMTFYEYLIAMDKEVIADKLFIHPSNIAPELQLDILKELKNYFLVGGMPEAVNKFRKSNSFVDVFKIQDNILDSYRQDFHKYRPHIATESLDAVFEYIGKNIGSQLKYTHLDQGHSYKTNQKALNLLVKAMIVHKIPSTNPSGLPLGSSISNKFKACMLDIGLMQRLCEMDMISEWNKDSLLAMYRGSLAEQFVAQELLAWHTKNLYYWSRSAKSSNAEVDYLIVRAGRIYPIEVKSGPAGRLKSLHMCLAAYPNCPEGWVLQDSPYKELPEQKLVFWPLYATPQLGNRQRLPL
jgi:predicted AAA+ superfamily ATPase